MRAVFASLATSLALGSACAPVVQLPPPVHDEELPKTDLGGADTATSTTTAATPYTDPARAEAPVGKGARTGTIDRAHMVAVLDAGPGAFLRQLEVTPRLDGQKFVGWQLVQLIDRGGPLANLDLAPGDVLLAVNGNALSRPDQLQAVWDGLRKANEVTAEIWRGRDKVTLKFDVQPKL